MRCVKKQDYRASRAGGLSRAFGRIHAWRSRSRRGSCSFNIDMSERQEGDFLGATLLQQFKIFLLQVLDNSALLIGYDNLHLNQLGSEPNGFILIRWLRLT